MGVLTEAERTELERLRADKSITYINSNGVHVSTIREYTVDEWKALRPKVNDEARERYRKRREEEEAAKHKSK